MHVEPGISEDIVGAVRRALRELGFDAAAPSSGLVVPGSAADALFDRAAAHLDDDALALTLAARIPIGGLGNIDYGLCTSATLRDALSLVARNYGVATQRVRLELVEGESNAQLVGHRLPGISHSRHWVELSFAVIAVRMRQTLGRDDLAFTRVSFRHDAPPRRAAHDSFFRTCVEFGAADDRLAFDPSLLDEPLRTASRELAELLDRRMRELAPALAPEDPVLDRVRRTLAAMLDEGTLDLDTLVTRLGESRRTLQRLLGERSTSYSTLVDELRRERSAELLDQGLRIADVAARLGFTAPSAFFRAYRRWTGTSPKRGAP